MWGVVLPSSALALNISGDGQKAIVALKDGTIRWYNLSNGEELLVFFPHKDGQNWIAWTPSGYYMSSGKDAENSLLGWHVNHGLDQEASFYPIGELYSKIYNRPEVVQRTLIDLSEDEALWELDTENLPNEPPGTPILRVETGMHTTRINQFDIDANEQFLVTASHDKTLRLWELETGKLLAVYRVPIGEDNEGFLYSTALSPDSQWIATAGETGKTWENDYLIYLFDRTTGQLTRRLMGLPSSVAHLCFSPDGQYLAASLEEEGIRIWETQEWAQIFSDTQYEQSSQTCQFDSNNRLLTTSLDAYLRLYSATGNDHFSLVKHIQAPGGKRPFHVVFSPKGDKIVVGFDDSTQINVLDGQTLELLYVPDTSGVDDSLFSVAWSFDEQRICAGGHYLNHKGNQLIRCWLEEGRGHHTDWIASSNTILQLRFLKNGNLIYSSASPSWGLLDNVGQKRQEHIAQIVDYRSIQPGGANQERKILWTSYKGNIVQFGFGQGGERPAQFSLNSQHFRLYPFPDSSLQQADTNSLNITDWQHTLQPKLNGTALPFFENDRSRSLAIAPDKSWFVLGTELGLQSFEATGEYLGGIPLPSPAWAVNFSGDGHKIIAALGDGTIHWYNNKELLTFFPHVDGKRWIVWTPSGYYMSSGEDAENLLGWHVNQGKDKAALFYPISALQTEFKRPDIVKKVLDTLSEEKAVLVANLEKKMDVGEQMTQRQRLELAKEKYQVNLTPSGFGKAIIVAASGEQEKNSLFPYTNKATQAMYNLLHDRGFSDSDIIYLNPIPPVVPPNGYVEIGRQDFPLRDPLTELSQAMIQAANELKSGQQFIFYLHGHARQHAIQLSPLVELSAQALKELLTQIPQDIPQIIILDTCYSGSFLEELSGVPNRIVVTSADSDSKAWSNEGKSFADQFIRQLNRGNSLYESFDIAEKMIVNDPQIFGSQRPQLDDNQDSRYLKEEDGLLARRTFLGNQKVSASLPPSIAEVHPALYLPPEETTATLWVKTSVDMNTVNTVRAILTNEHDQPTEYQGENTSFTHHEITLTPNYETERFETEYSGFQAAQQWRIFYQVETVEGQWSDFAEGYVQTGGDALSITLEAKMNQPTYQFGDPFRFEVITVGEGNFDLYVGLIFPDGNYYTIRPPFQFSAKNKLEPYQQNVLLTGVQTFTVFSLVSGLLPAMPPGEYQACGVLTKAQSDPNDITHWVKWHCQGFRF